LDNDPRSFTCPKCGDILELLAPPLTKKELVSGSDRLSVWRYQKALPIADSGAVVSMGEGGTPLVPSKHSGKQRGMKRLSFKVEGQNPTGSFKDRGMTVAVSRARLMKARVLVCASTGNTAASLAAYAARGGMDSGVIMPSGKVAAGKLMQAIAHGSRLVQIEDGFDRALKILSETVAKAEDLYLVNSINPYRIEGQKTVAFEIFEQLGDVPDYLVLPVGNAGNISAVWKGFKELREWGVIDRTPRLIGVQAEGASPLAEAYEKSGGRIRPWKQPETIATAIRIGNPVSWKKALNAVNESSGRILAVSDEEILAGRKELATKEGIFVENASATPVAGLGAIQAEVKGDDTVVTVLTGHGLKDSLPREWKKERPRSVSTVKELAEVLLGRQAPNWRN